MNRELFEKRKKVFKETVISRGNLPKNWEIFFDDGESMRIWFERISKINEFKDYVDEINSILIKFNKRILSDDDRKIVFKEYVKKYDQIPMLGERFFSDNLDMNIWYSHYKNEDDDYETLIHNSLSEYNNFDLVEIWPLCKKEFINVIKIMKRIPRHGEVRLQNDIDVRTIYDKLYTYDPTFSEKLLLHLQTYRTNGLNLDDRCRELLNTVNNLGYIPYLQESRFSDGTDMFTWYTKYKNSMPELKEKVDKLILSNSIHNINIYLIPNFKNKGGKFYTICSNEGERLDLSGVSSYEEALKLDKNLVRRGGLILKKNEEIKSVNFKKGK